MLRTLAAIVTADRIRIALAGAAIALAFKTISQVMEERVEYLAYLESAVEEKRARLLAMPDTDEYAKSHKAQDDYPSREDLDPLGAGLD